MTKRLVILGCTLFVIMVVSIVGATPTLNALDGPPPTNTKRAAAVASLPPTNTLRAAGPTDDIPDTPTKTLLPSKTLRPTRTSTLTPSITPTTIGPVNYPDNIN